MSQINPPGVPPTPHKREEQVADWEKRYDRDRRIGRFGAILAVLLLIAGIFVANKVLDRTDTIEENYAKLYEQFVTCQEEAPDAVGCEKPAVPSAPEASPGTQVVPSATVRALVQAIFDDCVTSRVCVGAAGRDAKQPKDGENGKDAPIPKDGVDGLNATDAQVADKIAAYCAANNGCKGDTGGQGPPGYPESFTYTDALLVEHVCTDADNNHHYECT